MFKKIFFLIYFGLFFGLLFLKSIQVYQQPVGVIVPHHDVVADVRVEFLSQIAKTRTVTKKVILFSTNHFSPDQRQIFYSLKTWDLSTGLLSSLTDTQTELFSDIGAAADYLVQADHGVTSILSDIKTIFPKSQIAAFIIGEKVTAEKLDLLTQRLTNYCGWDCLILASVDFSHYLPANLADVHDVYTWKNLKNENLKGITSAETDCPNCLYLITRFAQEKQAGYSLFAHTNSSRLFNSPDIESTSHLFGDFRRGQKPDLTTIDYFTFVYATNIVPHDKPGLGERFFYGADVTDTQLTQPVTVSENIKIIPVSDLTSRIEYLENKFTIYLGKDLAVAGIQHNFQTKLIFAPLDHQNFVLLRNQEKKDYLNRFLANLPSGDFYQADLISGLLYIP